MKLSRRWVAALFATIVLDLLLSIAHEMSDGDGWLADVVDQDSLRLSHTAATMLALISAGIVARLWLHDRRDLHRAEQSLAATETTTHDWLWETDQDRRLTYCSQSVQDILGYRPDELVGVHDFDLLYDEANREEARVVSHAGAPDGGWVDTELCWRHKDGNAVWLVGRGAPMHDEHGRLVGYRGNRHFIGSDADAYVSSRGASRRIKTLLADQDVSIALQPIVDLGTGQLAGVEALARFGDGRSPDLWFRDARVANKTRDLDELTFLTALNLLDMLAEDVYLSVNASPDLLMTSAFRQRLLALELPLSRLVIEITEHDQVPSYLKLNTAIDELRRNGVRFAIDDTGAGYASLAHVIELRPDIIKLDRALIADLDRDRARRALVTSLVLLALEVGAKVTGEGVETSTQMDALITLGVDQGQGYHLARPTTDHQEWAAWSNRCWTVRPDAPVTP